MVEDSEAANTAADGAAGTAGTCGTADGADGADGADAKSPASLAAGDSGACDALVAATLENPGAPFAPETLPDLAMLKGANRVQFESLRTRLKKAGCRVTELDGLIAEAAGDRRDGRPPSHADILVALGPRRPSFSTPPTTSPTPTSRSTDIVRRGPSSHGASGAG
jgi:hypothetical protein